jgi:hypothetical protein
MLGQRTVPVTVPPTLPTASPRPSRAEEEDQATILQRTIGVSGPLAAAIGSAEPPVGRVLHAVLQETNPAIREAAREAVIEAFKRDPEVERAYLSTLTPVEDATLATMLAAMGPGGAAQEWMQALASRAPSMPLRLKATTVLAALQQQR